MTYSPGRRGLLLAALLTPICAPVAAAWARPGTRTVRVEGSDVEVDLPDGDVGMVLAHVLSRIHTEVEPLEVVVAGDTFVTVHPERHPAGTTGTFFPAQVAAIGAVLADCSAAVRWDGAGTFTVVEASASVLAERLRGRSGR